MRLKYLVLLLCMATASSAYGAQSDKLYLQGELFKGEEPLLHIADSLKSGDDTNLSSLLQGSYLNAADPSEQEMKLVPWTYITGVMLKLNPMLAGDGSVLLTVHGFQSSVSEFKGTKANPELKIPEVVIGEVNARQILEQGKPGEIRFGNCKGDPKKPTSCDYTLRVTVTTR